ncbi:uncharacterized protein LOC111917829 [Lactuca sativa]|uniref:uncharacterized protein LOC111917829 n=1 Tax=Lactuca sativa TaxID=4236 RepID=UPI000CD7E9AB|nr:uncharacterized protein LOC111917829 [Lactuca sativa]
MSHNANSSDGPDSSNVNEYDEWEARAVQQNRKLDVIMSELLISIPNMSVRDHPRAKRRYCDREREQGEARLMKDYFVDNPTYGEEKFRGRFRMQKPLFLHIMEVVTANDRYFQQIRDATGRQGLSPLQKCTRAMRVLAYGTSTDAHDEYSRMSETITRDALVKFVEGVISCFHEEYLGHPDQDDLARLLHVGEERGFPGMMSTHVDASAPSSPTHHSGFSLLPIVSKVTFNGSNYKDWMPTSEWIFTLREKNISLRKSSLKLTM